MIPYGAKRYRAVRNGNEADKHIGLAISKSPARREGRELVTRDLMDLAYDSCAGPCCLPPQDEAA
jgi:hypothetical protein